MITQGNSPVIQADWEAAYDLIGWLASTLQLEGDVPAAFRDRVIDAFAAHRLSSNDVLVDALRVTRQLVADCAVSGFTEKEPLERLFLNQATLTQALASIQGAPVRDGEARAPDVVIAKIVQRLRDEAQTQRVAKDAAYFDGRPWKAYKYASEVLDRIAAKLEVGK